MTGRRKKLLIVDDSTISRRFIERSFGGHEFEVAMAADGVAAMGLLHTFEPDLVTMDLTMPNMDGLTCVSKMIAVRPDIQILVISALKDKYTAVEAVKRGAQGLLLKPFTQEALQERITILASAFDDVASDDESETPEAAHG